MSDGNSIINFGEISKPATVLIEKISDALGGYFKPYQIKRVAKAEAEADIIKVKNQIEISSLEQRAVQRFVSEEAKKQENIESITTKALPNLNDDSDPEDIEDDWIVNFFDKCRLISNEEMQNLWSKVLSGEANSPGSYSKRTINFLSSLDREDAKLFTALCGFGLTMVDFMVLITDEKEKIYNKHGINFNSLTHLDEIGLITFDPLAGFRRLKLPDKLVIDYHGMLVNIEFPYQTDNVLNTGKVYLSKTGKELAKICKPSAIDGFLIHSLRYWVNKNKIVPSSLIKPKN